MRLEAQNINDVSEDSVSVPNSIGLQGATGSSNSTLRSLSNVIKGNVNKISNAFVQSSSSSEIGQHLHHGPIKNPIQITNISTSHQLSDTLHHRSKSILCTNHACLGSIMAGHSKQAYSGRTSEEILDQAVDFLEQYFIYLKKPSSNGLAQRLAEIAPEIERTGTYTMTSEELHFGAKTAWRNASRCIGRIQWNKLELQDARHVKNTKEMFAAICKHIECATNGGNLKSMITVFPQRILGRDDFRVWNSQLISYAGYQQHDGSVIGDAAKVQFTRVCQRLGWKGKGGKFDILPIIVSAPGEGPKLYEIPEELVLRVNIEHPNYEWLEQMGLEWYALPAVSEMMFDCGGLQFTAAPFNGWYMGTEIGARDLCDPQRYNITENVGKRMGLDISNSTSLWKDRVLIEVNIAVLYSFQKSGVTVVDHHTASESFIKHMHNEQRLRGGCPADWVWIVPPISASITPVFHQEMVNYSLKPSYEYQENAWKSYKWSNINIKLKYKFSSISKAALWSVMLMNSVMTKRVRATILYSTETGKSENLAQKLAKLMHISFFVHIQCMEDYNFENLINESLLIIVTSTFGNGEPPDNGKKFWKELYNFSYKRNATKLSHINYGVFALGSSQYPTFCTFGKNVDKALRNLGANQLISIGLGDELRAQEQSFQLWANDCYKNSCSNFNIDIDINEMLPSFAEKEYDPKKVRITEIAIESGEQQILHNMAKLHRKKIIPCKIISSVRLQPPKSERQTLLVRLTASNQIAKNMLNYEPGDHFAIFPCNPTEIVEALLGHVRRDGYDDPNYAILQVEFLEDGKWTPDSRLPPCSLRTALTNYLDITTPPTQTFLSHLINMANDRWDSFRLKKLSTDVNDYEKWRAYNYPTMADVLNEFPSVHVDPEFLLTQLPLLQPRFYSISSSRKVNPDEVHLTMGLVWFKIHDGTGPKRYGVCTSYFDTFPNGDIPCFLRSAPTFRLPSNAKIPVIMIGAGSGIAPFRSFWQERQALMQNGHTCGKMFLFFGCRNSKIDNIYGPELTSLLRKGILHELFLALSREPGHKKRYVGEQVFKQRSLLYWLICNESAHIYVCGDSLMADGVKKAFVKVFENQGNKKETEAIDLVDELINDGRYHEDVFGVLHR